MGESEELSARLNKALAPFLGAGDSKFNRARLKEILLAEMEDYSVEIADIETVITGILTTPEDK